MLMASYRVAVVGGTGPQGKGLAYRFAREEHDVVLGSRAAEKAETAVAEIVERLPRPQAGTVVAAQNADACAQADVVLLAIPYDGHDEVVVKLPLTDKIVISCVNPLAFDKRGAHGQVVDDGRGSAAESAQRVAPGATVVGAFHHVSAVKLWGPSDYLEDEDVLVCGDSAEGKHVAIEPRAQRDRPPRCGCRQPAPCPPAGAAHRRAHQHQPQVQDPRRGPDLGSLTGVRVDDAGRPRRRS